MWENYSISKVSVHQMLRKMVSVEGSKRNTEMSKEEEVQEFETGGMSTGKPCPLSNASIFSFLTWQWVQPLITIGNKKTLEVCLISNPSNLII